MPINGKWSPDKFEKDDAESIREAVFTWPPWPTVSREEWQWQLPLVFKHGLDARLILSLADYSYYELKTSEIIARGTCPISQPSI